MTTTKFKKHMQKAQKRGKMSEVGGSLLRHKMVKVDGR